jgi:hypothetical protein
MPLYWMKTKDSFPSLYSGKSFTAFDDEHPSKDPEPPTGHRMVGMVETLSREHEEEEWRWSMMAPLGFNALPINGKSKSRGAAARMVAEAYRQWLRG